MVAIRLYNLLPKGTIAHDGEIESLVVEAEIQAEGEIGNAVTQVHFVVIVDHTVGGNVYITYITRLRIRLQEALACCTPFVDFLLVLEDTVRLIAPEVTDGLAILRAVELGTVVVQLVAGAVDDTVFRGDAAYLVLVERTVQRHIVVEVLTDLVVPGQGQFHTRVLHVTTVDVGSARTGSSQNRRGKQPVFGALHIEIEIYAQTAVQEAGIKTDVGLFGSFPRQFFVGQTAGISAPVGTQGCCFGRRTLV